ncbi:MAG: FAD:protein FMN transferase [Burkholderiales bacterium]|nr:FAD:protein FMN transferase [Burkholderiales bacterium]MDE1926818.1 FAD:protein FMN transferase [Burkholderiales bacterium]MDE2160521.1 FAD:protein FMN transferase [Burkholderiales bacterium]MDE2504603.1 FAD:protein FMN transferase [Burkholderiales bacterium]
MNALRRARPLLGTLVEIGAAGPRADAALEAALEAAFERLFALQSRLSRFDPASEIARFNALEAGAAIEVGADARAVLEAARGLGRASAGLFDIAGGGRWELDASTLRKIDAGTKIDLGGIAKGYAVDAAIELLRERGCGAGWVNAGGDLRAYGDVELALLLRDEKRGGVRAWGRLRDGACATSRYARASRCTLHGRARLRHLSVTAPLCLWADALTKVAAQAPDHPLLAAHGASAWHH